HVSVNDEVLIEIVGGRMDPPSCDCDGPKAFLLLHRCKAKGAHNHIRKREPERLTGRKIIKTDGDRLAIGILRPHRDEIAVGQHLNKGGKVTPTFFVAKSSTKVSRGVSTRLRTSSVSSHWLIPFARTNSHSPMSVQTVGAGAPEGGSLRFGI